MKANRLSRRKFLRSSGVMLALPLLDATLPGARAAGKPAAPRRRMVAVTQTLGMHAPLFFPERPGRDYTLSPYLEPLKEFREDITVFSGVSHPEYRTRRSAAATRRRSLFSRGLRTPARTGSAIRSPSTS
jgi:hypothetical protein